MVNIFLQNNTFFIKVWLICVFAVHLNELLQSALNCLFLDWNKNNKELFTVDRLNADLTERMKEPNEVWTKKLAIATPIVFLFRFRIARDVAQHGSVWIFVF